MKISFSNKFDTKENLVIIYEDKNDLIKKIDMELNSELGLEKDQYKLSGVLILFNNLIQI